MISEDLIKSAKNDTPVGFASWCWAAGIRYPDYQGMATERGIPPLNEEDFNYIWNWWDEQYYA